MFKNFIFFFKKYVSYIESMWNVQVKSGRDSLYYVTVAAASYSEKQKKQKPYQKWSSQKRFKIEKYAAISGHTAATRKLGSKSRPIN